MIKKRPGILTLICVLGFIWITFTFPGVFSPSVKKMGDFIPAIYGLIIAGTFISFIGVWHMKRWGVESYITLFFIKMLFFLFTDQLNGRSFLGILFSLWFIVTFIVFYKRMDINL